MVDNSPAPSCHMEGSATNDNIWDRMLNVFAVPEAASNPWKYPA